MLGKSLGGWRMREEKGDWLRRPGFGSLKGRIRVAALVIMQIYLHSDPCRPDIQASCIGVQNEVVSVIGLFLSSGLSQTFRDETDSVSGRRSKLKHRELGLIQGFLLCLWDSEVVRL